MATVSTRSKNLNEDFFKTLQQVIGTPKENSLWMVKAVLKDMKLSCTKCGLAYRSDTDKEQLSLDIDEQQLTNSLMFDPGKLHVKVDCSCGHSGEIDLQPNPLVVT